MEINVNRGQFNLIKMKKYCGLFLINLNIANQQFILKKLIRVISFS